MNTWYKCSLFAESLKEMFSVTYSVDQRSAEEQAYVFFGDFLDDCEGRVFIEVSVYVHYYTI